MMKNLYSPEGNTWRLWSGMARSNDDNIYNWIYKKELGEEGACKRKGCTEESETTDHAICGCKWAQKKWEYLDAHLDRDWALKGWDWSKVSWIANEYEGWERLWTAT